MIIVHYDEKTGKVIQAYSSEIDEVPMPNIVLHEEQWNKIYDKDLWVDLTTRTITFKDKVPTKEEQSQKRGIAYTQEADPLFFLWQRGEATKDEWLNKIQEIKDRFPYPEDVK